MSLRDIAHCFSLLRTVRGLCAACAHMCNAAPPNVQNLGAAQLTSRSSQLQQGGCGQLTARRGLAETCFIPPRVRTTTLRVVVATLSRLYKQCTASIPSTPSGQVGEGVVRARGRLGRPNSS